MGGALGKRYILVFDYGFDVRFASFAFCFLVSRRRPWTSRDITGRVRGRRLGVGGWEERFSIEIYTGSQRGLCLSVSVPTGASLRVGRPKKRGQTRGNSNGNRAKPGPGSVCVE